MKNTTKYHISENELKELYINKGMNQVEVAKYFGCSVSVIDRKITEYNIPRHNRKKYDIPLDELKKEYVDNKISIEELSKKYKCSVPVIYNRLQKIGILETTDSSGIPNDEFKELLNKGYSHKQLAEHFHCNVRTIQVKAQRLKIKKPELLQNVTREELYQKYIIDGKDYNTLCKEYNVSEHTLFRKLKELNIDVRDRYHISEEVIRELYINQNKSQKEIAKELGFGEDLISKKLKEYSIVKDYHLRCERSRKNNINKEFRWSCITDEILEEYYMNQNLPACKIAEMFNWSASAVSDKIYSHGFYARKSDEDKEICLLRAREQALSCRHSKAELELNGLFPTKHTGIHNVIGFELDLWYPKERVAIEYNGDYWHSNKVKRSSSHLAKTTICEDKEIYLLNIPEHKWVKEQEKLKIINIISQTLSTNTLSKVSGYIKVLDKNEQITFENKNNIENYKPSQYCIGISKNNIILASLSFNIIDNICEIINFTTSIGYIEDYKLLIEYIKEEYNIDQINLKCNRSYYDGRIFRNIGFIKTGIEKPFKQYIKRYNILNPETDDISDSIEVYTCGYSLWSWYKE